MLPQFLMSYLFLWLFQKVHDRAASDLHNNFCDTNEEVHFIAVESTLQFLTMSGAYRSSVMQNKIYFKLRFK